jgi:hypothetical protein
MILSRTNRSAHDGSWLVKDTSEPNRKEVSHEDGVCCAWLVLANDHGGMSIGTGEIAVCIHWTE